MARALVRGQPAVPEARAFVECWEQHVYDEIRTVAFEQLFRRVWPASRRDVV
jgi:hypothetical protein